MSKPIVFEQKGAQALLTRPIAEVPESALEDLLLGAAKPDTEWYVGLELELFPWRRSAPEQPVGYDEVSRILAALHRAGQWEDELETGDLVVGLRGGGRLVSLEPGGQVEFASRPHRSLKALREETQAFCAELTAAAASEAVRFWAMGYHPYLDVPGQTKTPKRRYDAMRSYLGTRGARALEMMHLTGSVQCTVDFKDATNRVDKIRTAARATPFLTALTASSPFYRGQPNGFRSLRYQVWLETDDERCGLWPEMFDAEGLSVRRYIRRAMALPPMFFVRKGVFLPAEAQSFEAYGRSGFEGSTVTVADFIDHLTSLFPEVRPKGYVELRGADGLPPDYAVAIAGFWRGILDDEPTRRGVEARLASIDYEEARRLQAEVARNGLDASSQAGPVRAVVRWLVDAAYQRLKNGAPDCAECLEPLVALAESGRSFADVMLETYAADGIEAALAPVVLGAGGTVRDGD